MRIPFGALWVRFASLKASTGQMEIDFLRTERLSQQRWRLTIGNATFWVPFPVGTDGF